MGTTWLTSLAGKVWGAGAIAHKAFQAPSALSPKELVSSSSEHQHSTSAQGAVGSPNLLGPKASIYLGEKQERAAFLNKHALGLSLVS